MIHLSLWRCIFGPRLYRIYAAAQQVVDEEEEDLFSLKNNLYSANFCEKFGNNIVRGINVMWNIGLYTSPLIITYLYRKEYFCLLGCVSLGRFATGIGILLIVGMIMRGLGRYVNPSYNVFLNTLLEAQNNPSPDAKNAMSRYDFEFWAWPIDFSVKDVEGEDTKPFTQVERSLAKGKVGPVLWALGLPCEIAAFCCVHLFGRHLLYPGSIQLLQFLLGTILQNGREKLVIDNKGVRNKILSRDGNAIDTMFVDRRGSKKHIYGSTLVLCCEGNAGFYEIGTMATPLDAGYSVLGWNQPGFAGSTGTPFPSQSQHAVDSVMQFAIHKLGFKPEEIIVYSWSIGGYPGTWIAMNYPQIRGLILDATFDDILPLAIPRMPMWMSGLVKHTIRQYMNLNNADQLCRYSGPVTIIRRTNDEIISTIEGNIGTNRGNDLLTKLLRYRYPVLYGSTQASETLRQWFSEDPKVQEAVYRSWNIDEEVMLTQLVTFIEQHGESFPLQIGDDWNDEQKTRMLLFLAHKVLVNFVSTHNNPLETRHFKLPWTPMADQSYVQL